MMPVVGEDGEPGGGRISDRLFDRDAEKDVLLTSGAAGDQSEIGMNTPGGHHTGYRAGSFIFSNWKSINSMR
ncbi:MAG: hypothetical protein ACHRHE_23535 [Tepidisphaerales bacterium]